MTSGVAAILLFVCYRSTLLGMADQWTNDEDMSHGFAIPLAVAWVVDKIFPRKPQSPV